jgi:mRNA-degrading endonuclease RelE of RelBE toxin-antitoxin system
MIEIQYHPKIVDDLSRISASIKKDIRSAIEEKLTTAPEFFGKPLQFSLKGLRSMRVGDYRVIFLLSRNTVRVILIAHRSTVYNDVAKRA